MSIGDGPAQPFCNGLYRNGALIAGQSRLSGRVQFPKPNPSASDDEVGEVVLGKACTLFSFTVVHMKTAHFDPPYAIGYVDFPERVRVFGPIRTNNFASLRVGMPMSVEIEPLWCDVDGTPIVGHRFVPAERNGS
jgi:uncharacterized protein